MLTHATVRNWYRRSPNHSGKFPVHIDVIAHRFLRGRDSAVQISIHGSPAHKPPRTLDLEMPLDQASALCTAINQAILIMQRSIEPVGPPHT